ncbi:vesicular glutamate transporter 3-like [Babylonia areolata]|uniref:vesicular glutamate transporter 3-like n=1 Tax=Babylonia areolata TaxID=304850 RepID=UPI003FD374D1
MTRSEKHALISGYHKGSGDTDRYTSCEDENTNTSSGAARGNNAGAGASASAATNLFPARYFVTLLGAAGLLCTVGSRKSFAITLTHVAADETGGVGAATAEEMFFPNCTVMNTSRDWHMPMGEDTMFQLHSFYYVGGPVVCIAVAILASTKLTPVFMAGCGVLLSSVLTICIPFVLRVSVPWLFVLRLVQGGIDGIQQPCSMGVLSAWATDSDKSSIFTIYFTGAYLAPALAALLSGVSICYISWDSVLFGLGACGVVWSIVWIVTVPNSPRAHPSLSGTEAELHGLHVPDDCHHHHHSSVGGEKMKACAIPWRHVLTSLPVWSAFLGMFCHTHVYSMLVVEQAEYFSDAFNIHIADIGLLTTIPHVGLSIACLLGGALADKLLSWGLSATFTRKLLFSVGKVTEGACLVGLYFTSDWQTAITLITVGVSVGGLAEAGYQPIPAEIAPQFATVISACMGVGSIGSFFNTFVASFILGSSKTLTDWQCLFLISGVLDLVCVLAFAVMAKAELQPWAL